MLFGHKKNYYIKIDKAALFFKAMNKEQSKLMHNKLVISTISSNNIIWNLLLNT